MSKFLGVLATVTEDGTIQLPLDMLKTAGIQPNTKVELFADTSHLFIRTAEKFCDVCGVNANTTRIGYQEICKDCLDRIAYASQERQNMFSE
ncbi:AbrB/MazE/SpoVT family DNA-binding domain-containing protein [Bacillus mycoides]|uniref:AbrB/MazE/SpoVT family DNA-binding domain-containing protein n=1 Tax=Bacillus mycoides TaxID=1405 RepID=UPI0025A1896B|nr:AbrB/MazE/SpoVT family DNA-binding domain-containing protein [Bacillus mycoides]MDM5429061.1 AbrB/MazE/SpoVT family DNA-binding domain-containing protein [Bacillus mycoides]MED1405303.1 AbrB/MazE/SpoVT family DNA-binding domain-containing protein [Bacillus mycoides]